MSKPIKTMHKAVSKGSKSAHNEGKTKEKAAIPSSSQTDKGVVVDRRASRDRRGCSDRRTTDVPVAAERRKLERRVKVNRRRQIDPTTCERDYSTEEIEFMTAIGEYKRTSGRMFPTCSEILEVLRRLGYEKRVLPTPAPDALPTQPDVSSATPATPATEA